MIIIQIFLTFVFLLVSLNLSNKIHRIIISFFVFSYSLQLVLAELDLYKIYEISSKTILIFNCNIIFFLLGACLYEISQLKLEKFQKTISIDKDVIFNNKSFYNINWLIFIQFIFLIIALYYFRRMSLAVLLFSNTDSIRTYFFEAGGLFNSYTEMFIYHYLVRNYIYVASFIFTYIVLLKEKRSKKDFFLMILSAFFIGVIAFTSQGRGDILLPFIMSIFLLFYSKCYFIEIYKKRAFPLTLLLGLTGFIVISIISLLRVKLDVNYDSFVLGINEEIFKPFITYFSVPIAAFDFGINHIFENKGHYFGTATFAGLQELIATPFIFIDKSIALNIANAQLGSLMSPTFSINSTTTWNALFTGVLNYYLDFGYFGVIFYPLAIGYIFSRLLFEFLKKSDFLHLMLFAVFFTWLFNNLISSSFQSFSNWMLLLNIIIYQKMFKSKQIFKRILSNK